jgi:hypothetical protein
MNIIIYSVYKGTNQGVLRAMPEAIQTVITAMTTHIDNPQVQIHACVALRNILCHEGNSFFLFFFFMYCYLRTYLFLYVVENLHLIVTKGGIERIVETMHHHKHHAQVQSAGCAALWNITAFTGKIVDLESLKKKKKEK